MVVKVNVKRIIWSIYEIECIYGHGLRDVLINLIK